MRAKILSLNVGHPTTLEWRGRPLKTSMCKTPVAGPLRVETLNIEGDSFADPRFHGTPDSVLYALGVPSALAYVKYFGLATYAPGTVGENLTLDAFDEELVSVGDTFRCGTVEVQATFPRVPCAKLNWRMQSADGQTAMQTCGRSGVYFRILKPGQITLGDGFERLQKAAEFFSIFEVYQLLMSHPRGWPEGARRRALANGAFPRRIVDSL